MKKKDFSGCGKLENFKSLKIATEDVTGPKKKRACFENRNWRA